MVLVVLVVASASMSQTILPSVAAAAAAVGVVWNYQTAPQFVVLKHRISPLLTVVEIATLQTNLHLVVVVKMYRISHHFAEAVIAGCRS